MSKPLVILEFEELFFNSEDKICPIENNIDFINNATIDGHQLNQCSLVICSRRKISEVSKVIEALKNSKIDYFNLLLVPDAYAGGYDLLRNEWLERYKPNETFTIKGKEIITI